ncbi:hypothetical protein [Methanosarcina siciliae]|uniref:hypothetical protein n=1 Tax=Methanosarcina siciliae TaxID=38027 RepID=UPI001E388975|nr:hypothetical protein [Methanosarcina siciliae]
MACVVEASPVAVDFESFPTIFFLVIRKSFWRSSGSNGDTPESVVSASFGYLSREGR